MESEHLLIALAGVVALGVGAQWLAWRIRVPSILLLLLLGVVAGPVTGLLHPDELFGKALLPITSISVALILYEGGLSLRLRELKKVGWVVLRLLTVGAVVTWVASAWAAYLILGLELPLAILLGGILVVTGPTVVGPLLQYVRPVGPTSAILKWEGIAIDPIGAMLAVLAFEAMFLGEGDGVWRHGGLVLLKSVAVGGGLGLLGALVLAVLLGRFMVPDELQNPVSMMIMLVAFVASHLIQEESGLFAATVMGIALANQNKVPVKRIIEFKEELRGLLIALLFILLGARLKMEDITAVGFRSVVFVVVMILAVRPLSVLASVIGSRLKWQEWVLLGWMAPRGIVAAAVSSVFALRLAEADPPHPQAGLLVSTTFAVIVGTVTVYSLTAPALARRLKISDTEPQGLLIVGASSWARALAEVLVSHGFRVMLVDTNYGLISAARSARIPTYLGSILSEHTLNNLDLDGIGRFLAATPNDEVNTLAVQRFLPLFKRAGVYQLVPEKRSSSKAAPHGHERGRYLFGPDVTYQQLEERAAAGAIVKATPLSEKFDYEAFRQRYGPTAVPLFVIDQTGKLQIVTSQSAAKPQPGQTVIALVDKPS